MIMYCHKCGTENGDHLYCHACGENLSPEDMPLLDMIPAPKAEHLMPVPDDKNPSAENPVSASLPVRPPRAAKNPMKFSTRVAYNILESDRKTVAVTMIALVVLVAGVIAVASCLGLVSSFATLSDANRALPSGIQSEEIQQSIDAAGRSIWRNVLVIPLSLLAFFLSARLLVRIRRVADTLKAVRKRFD